MSFQYKSPFPGFDPYLQRRWESYHVECIMTLRDAIRGRLPEGLKARVETRVCMEITTEEGVTQQRKTRPDLMIVEFPESYPKPGDSFVVREDTEPAVAEPVTITLREEEIRERFIQIVDLKDDDRVITTIEVLSPSNKTPGGGREEFMAKQAENWQAGVSLVELDFIRGGKHSLSLPMPFRSDPSVVYQISIVKGWLHGTGQIYPIKLCQRLPTISVPLRRTDEPLSLDLQWVHDAAYDRGECALDIKYHLEPEPPLSAADAAWADQLLKSKGLR
jgi:hypothetical protein